MEIINEMVMETHTDDGNDNDGVFTIRGLHGK